MLMFRIQQHGCMFLCSFILSHLISDLMLCSGSTDHAQKRQKRSLICFFGLTGILSDAVYHSLTDLHEYDPLRLGYIQEYKLKNGVLKGLSTLTNLSNIDVYCNEDKIIILSATVGMTNTEVHFDWTRRAVFKFHGTIGVKAREVAYQFEVQLNTTGGMNFKVSNSLLTKLEKFQFDFTGMWVLNPMIEGSVNLVYRIWRGSIIPKIERMIQHSLESKFHEIAEMLGILTHLV